MDLHAPLGMKPSPEPRPPFAGSRGRIAAGAVVVAAMTGIGIWLALSDPRAGEPFGVAAIPRQRPAGSSDGPAPLATVQGPAEPIRPSARVDGGVATASAQGDTVENGVKVFRSAPVAPPQQAVAQRGPLIIDVSKVLDDPLGRATAHTETRATGGIESPTVPTRRPRVAIFVSGMGLSQAATKIAMDTMPAGVTLAFVPYGASIAATVAAAKAKGHEVLLQIPMWNATGGAPGPHALRADEAPASVREDLAWLTSRFTGYDGVSNLLGAPVTADKAVMAALVRDIGARGLFYLDDGLSKRETGLAAAADLGVPARHADIVLDATADPSVIEANLRELEAIARREGSAIGMASGLPDHMATIARFAGGLADDGITLVPVADLVAPAPGKASGVAVSR